MKSVDFHCDVLYKLLLNNELDFARDEADQLDVTLERLKEAEAAIQTFAIYIPSVRKDWLVAVMESVDLFYNQILSQPSISFIRNKQDLRQCIKEGRIGALLSMEGVDGLYNNKALLHMLYRLGVRFAGLTWNYANWAADGVLEPRNGGLTAAGKEFVQYCEQIGMLLDISHLSDRGFWELAELTSKPFIASHSNAREVCSHPRNLTDSQIQCIIAREGRVGVTYVPQFLVHNRSSTIYDIVCHIEHICELGGEKAVMLGSDFDGIDTHVQELKHPGHLYRLKNELLKFYSEHQTNHFLAGNAILFLETNLPN
ncbi:dipeptidase [Paenibacillus sp. IITD108]|uniref:dipeptidase n=1 Tax=Paenibacillus sp. IITD108 TaxID=3116649 RepID=UPI002F3F39E2